MWAPLTSSLTIESLQMYYRQGALTPTALIDAIYRRIEACRLDNIWIHLIPKDEVLTQAAALNTQQIKDLPLYGIPFAIKDNIDVAGHPTTAACPAFSYIAEQSATVVTLLEAAGALLIGKTNLDQFATGLVGTRSPYGACPNPFDQDYISGGSSSGSAVAVSAGLVSFSLGTDTAGSGRVPAGFNNLVGVKPSRGLISTKGVVPACRSLDCVSIFALTGQDAQTVLDVAARVDQADPYSRDRPDHLPNRSYEAGSPFRFGIPTSDHLNFFGNREYEDLFKQAIVTLTNLGGSAHEIDYAPFAETADLLYGGPWVAERLWAIRDFLAEHPAALWPVTRQIIEGANRFTAVDVYDSQYRLQALRRQIEPIWRKIDCLLVPTSGTIYTRAEVEADPLGPNTNLGTYTNFVNLLDLCAWAVPYGFQANGLPMGITLIAPAFQDDYLGQIAATFQAKRGLPLGATVI